MDTFKLRIKDLQKVLHQETNTYFLDVSVEIFKLNAKGEEEVLSSQKHAYDPSISGEELEKELDIILAGFIRDEKLREDNAERDAQDKHVNELRDEFVGSELTPKKSKK